MKQFEKNIEKNTPEMFYTIGVLWGDGNIEYNRIRLSIKDKDFMINYKKKLEKWIGYKTKIKKINNNGFIKSHLYHTSFCSIYLSSLIKEKIKTLNKIKNKKLIYAFLEGAYDSEGSPDKDRLRIRFAVKDKKFYQLIKNYLEKINIKYKTFIQNKEYFCITISNEECIKFNNLIQFSVPKRKERLENSIRIYLKKQKRKEIKISETSLMKERDWCKKYNRTRNQYYRNKRLLNTISIK